MYIPSAFASLWTPLPRLEIDSVGDDVLKFHQLQDVAGGVATLGPQLLTALILPDSTGLWRLGCHGEDTELSGD